MWDDWEGWPPSPSSTRSVAWDDCESWPGWSWSPRRRRRPRKRSSWSGSESEENASQPSQDLVAGCWSELPEVAQKALIRTCFHGARYWRRRPRRRPRRMSSRSLQRPIKRSRSPHSRHQPQPPRKTNRMLLMRM